MKTLKEIVKAIQDTQSELFKESEEFNIKQAKIQKAIDDFKAEKGILVIEEELAKKYNEITELTRKAEKVRIELTHFLNNETGMDVKTKSMMIRPSQFVYGLAQKIMKKKAEKKEKESLEEAESQD